MVDINFYDAVYNVMLPLANLVQFVVIAEIVLIFNAALRFVYDTEENGCSG